MSLHVIASNDTLLATLRSSLQQNALPLASAVLRTPGSNLLASLQSLDNAPPGTIVLLDSPISFESTANDDLVVLDGWLRQRPHLNVLLLSEDNSKALLTRAMRAGVREVLQLPPDPTELAQTLRRWSERAASQAMLGNTTNATSPAAPPRQPPPPRRQPGRAVWWPSWVAKAATAPASWRPTWPTSWPTSLAKNAPSSTWTCSAAMPLFTWAAGPTNTAWAT